jgi:hypothetical protein
VMATCGFTRPRSFTELIRLCQGKRDDGTTDYETSVSYVIDPKLRGSIAPCQKRSISTVLAALSKR